MNNQNNTPEPSDIPQDVIEALAEIRDGCTTNMFDRRFVIHICIVYGYDNEANWLEANPDRYMEALIAMGKFVSERDSR